MNDDKDKTPPENEEERTVFMPSGSLSDPDPVPPAEGAGDAPAEPGEPPAEPPAAEAEAADAAPAEAPPVDMPPPADGPASPATTDPALTTQSFVPRADAVGIKVGDVLNHIFEVKRFLARGGMGEVFEGANVNTDEKVAIKVMLPALVNDEKVVAMFRKEARTLTKLHHQALVQYRVLAQEPQLGVLYIVTDFIDGINLANALGTIEPTPDELGGLLRRLASGLGAAHQLGAVHRDMSPDNVILADGDIHKAKIIDFGIAKDLDASSATIVGDGFAGKLNYVAPEQLGDYGREVGAWTDVYSLGLVILAVAMGKNVDMSGSLVDAIDKRRKGPDLSAVPENLRPLLEAMLRPDPKERLRSMDDVLAALEGTRIPSGQTMRDTLPETPPETRTTVVSAQTGGGAGKPLLIGGVLVGLLVAAGGAWYLSGGTIPGVTPSPVGPVTPGPAQPASREPAEVARAAVDSVLPSVPCTWLDISGIEARDGGVSVAVRGVAGNGQAAQDEIRQALTAAGLQNATLDFADVAPITPAGCAALDTYRQIRASADHRLSVPQTRFEMVMQSQGSYAGNEAANALLDLDLGDPNRNFTLLGIEPSGAITTLLENRSQFEAVLAQSIGGRPISREANGRYRLHIDLDHEGWSGFLLISGTAPFDSNLVQPGIGARGPTWQQQFLAAAAQRGWNSEMVWFESVNRERDGAGPGPSGPPQEGGEGPKD
jgi:hypothetical protein